MTILKPGAQVTILEDIRDNPVPAGTIATYDGDFLLEGWDNPRFTLPDGTKIWGVECWWEPKESTINIDESVKDLEEFKGFLRALANDAAECAKDGAS